MKTNEMPHPRKKLTPIASIKFYCKHICSSGDTLSWKHCTANRCTLFPYRLGKRPKKLPFEVYMKKTSPKEKHIEKQIDLTIKNEENNVLETVQEVQNGTT